MPEEDEPTPEEWAEIEAADAYLDAVGNERDFEGDQLGAANWRQDVDREPVAWPEFPSAHTARGELPPAPITGGTMPISEDAARIRAVAEDSSISATVSLAMSNLGDIQFPSLDADTAGALQEGLSALETNANAAGSAAGGEDEATIHGAAAVATQAIGETLAAVQQAAALLDQAAAAVQAARASAESAIAAAEQFRQTCSDIAGRHGA